MNTVHVIVFTVQIANLDIDIILVFLKRVHQLECLKIAKNFKIQKKTCPISIEFINVNGLMTYFL